jgi:hypothetical protein
LSELIVAWVGIAALAVIEGISHGIIVVSLDALDFMIEQEGEDSIGVRAERSHVTQAIDRVDASSSDFLKSSLQSEVVAVESTEQGNTDQMTNPLVTIMKTSSSDGSFSA